MKNAPAGTGAGSGQAVGGSISPRTPCPDAPACRRWIVAADDTVSCGTCYQPLERADLARMLAGRA